MFEVQKFECEDTIDLHLTQEHFLRKMLPEFLENGENYSNRADLCRICMSFFTSGRNF